MLARVLKTVATAHQILISSYLQWQWPGMKCFDVRKCFYKTVEAFLDPVSFFFSEHRGFPVWTFHRLRSREDLKSLFSVSPIVKWGYLYLFTIKGS